MGNAARVGTANRAVPELSAPVPWSMRRQFFDIWPEPTSATMCRLICKLDRSWSNSVRKPLTASQPQVAASMSCTLHN